VPKFAHNSNHRAAEARARWQIPEAEVMAAELDDHHLQRGDEPTARQGA
jgi:hypothetical protein